MKRLARYLKGYTKECILGPLFKLLEATLELFVPFVVAAMIDNGVETGNIPYLVKAMLILVLLLIMNVSSEKQTQKERKPKKHRKS